MQEFKFKLKCKDKMRIYMFGKTKKKKVCNMNILKISKQTMIEKSNCDENNNG